MMTMIIGVHYFLDNWREAFLQAHKKALISEEVHLEFRLVLVLLICPLGRT